MKICSFNIYISVLSEKMFMQRNILKCLVKVVSILERVQTRITKSRLSFVHDTKMNNVEFLSLELIRTLLWLRIMFRRHVKLRTPFHYMFSEGGSPCFANAEELQLSGYTNWIRYYVCYLFKLCVYKYEPMWEAGNVCARRAR